MEKYRDAEDVRQKLMHEAHMAEAAMVRLREIIRTWDDRKMLTPGEQVNIERTVRMMNGIGNVRENYTRECSKHHAYKRAAEMIADIDPEFVAAFEARQAERAAFVSRRGQA